MRPPPPPVLPTVAEVPCLHPDAEDAIGELRVEVLEAANLEGDWWSAADAYALLQFERHCAVSSIIWNQSNPAWGAHADHRAFRFPVHHSYSTLCVALVESDTHERAGLLSHFFDSDDHIGRVVIRLGTLYESTVYDSWFALDDTQKARSAIPDTKSAAGAALRLRYSVTFTTYLASDPNALLLYPVGSDHPAFESVCAQGAPPNVLLPWDFSLIRGGARARLSRISTSVGRVRASGSIRSLRPHADWRVQMGDAHGSRGGAHGGHQAPRDLRRLHRARDLLAPWLAPRLLAHEYRLSAVRERASIALTARITRPLHACCLSFSPP
jgi:hypothetical protein